MSWRVAKAITRLFQQLNAMAPNRSKRTDGTIGDADHRKRNSDHNPWVPPPYGGVVTAGDYTHDPKNGADMGVISERLRRSRDPRIKYVIYNRRIFASYNTAHRKAWEWGPYSGVNAHSSHMHVSVLPEAKHYDSTANWDIGAGSVEGEEAMLKRGDRGNAVAWFQVAYNGFRDAYGNGTGKISADGVYGKSTEDAVKAYQKNAGLPQTGSIDGVTAMMLGRFHHRDGSYWLTRSSGSTSSSGYTKAEADKRFAAKNHSHKAEVILR